MENASLISIVVIFVLGIFSQWTAWRIKWPSIVIMSVAGLVIGPIFGWVNPEQALNEFYSPIISLAVAIILFEASSSLDVREIKDISKSVFRMITVGAFLAWIGGALAAHYIAGLRLELSFIIGGLFIVTGPTVIIPLLRQAKLKPRMAAALKWEGIILDPVGPLLALFAYQVIKVLTWESVGFSYLLFFFLGALGATVLGLGAGLVISVLIGKEKLPEFLKSPILLSFILICFTISEMAMHETGMLAVTVMGLTLARTKKIVASIGGTGDFVENISVLLTSTVFILLTSSLSREVIGQVLSVSVIAFVVVMLFIVRPASIWLATIGTELTLKEKTLVSWIAPRGIVALTVAGYFAELLLEDGYEEAGILTALTFALVFLTVCAHGFTLRPLAKKFGLATSRQPGILIIGANELSVALAEKCHEMEIPVLVMDHSYRQLSQADEKNIKTHYGEILSEHTPYEVDLTPYESILAMTDEAAYNVLVCKTMKEEFGYDHTFLLPVRERRDVEQPKVSHAVKMNVLFGEKQETLIGKVREGYTLEVIKPDVEEKVSVEDVEYPGTLLFIRKEAGSIDFVTNGKKMTVNPGDELVVLCLMDDDDQ